MNFEQIKGILERVFTIVVTYAVAKGWVPVGLSDQIITVLIGVASIGWGWYVNTHSSLASATTAVKPSP